MAYSKGTGTKEDPYTIANIDDWMEFFNNKPSVGQVRTPGYVVLTGDIDFKDIQGKSLNGDIFCFPAYYFLDGQMHTLKNLKCKVESGIVKSGIIRVDSCKNLIITKMVINGMESNNPSTTRESGLLLLTGEIENTQEVPYVGENIYFWNNEFILSNSEFSCLAFKGGFLKRGCKNICFNNLITADNWFADFYNTKAQQATEVHENILFLDKIFSTSTVHCLSYGGAINSCSLVRADTVQNLRSFYKSNNNILKNCYTADRIENLKNVYAPFSNYTNATNNTNCLADLSNVPSVEEKPMDDFWTEVTTEQLKDVDFLNSLGWLAEEVPTSDLKTIEVEE